MSSSDCDILSQSQLTYIPEAGDRRHVSIWNDSVYQQEFSVFVVRAAKPVRDIVTLYNCSAVNSCQFVTGDTE